MAEDVGRSARPPLGGGRHPVYPVLLPIPVVCFVAALVSDAVYVGNPDMMWIDFSSWLLIGGGVAGLVLIVDMLRLGRARSGALVAHFALLLAAWVVAVFDSFIHARDGWTAVVPAGIMLSALAAGLSLIAGWFWQAARAQRPDFAR